MSIHKTNTGNVFVKYYARGPNGRRKEKREYFGRKPDAWERARERDSELKSAGVIQPYERQPITAGQPTFADIAGEYMQAKAGHMSKVSVHNLWYKMKNIILPALGNLVAAKIGPGRLDQYVEKRLATPVRVRVGKDGLRRRVVTDPDGTPRMISHTTVHRELSDIVAVMNWAVTRGYLKFNPVAGYRKPKRDDRIVRPPDKNEIQAILKHAAPHLARALLINYYTGLRPGNSELHRLQWHDIDWHSKTVLVRSARKGGPVKRSVSMHPDLEQHLAKWKEQDAKNEHPYIIYHQEKPVKSLKTAFAAAKRRAGITRRIRPYDFRHAAITQMILNGDLKAASEIAGHSSVEMTIRQYEHITSEIKRQTVAGIETIDF